MLKIVLLILGACVAVSSGCTCLPADLSDPTRLCNYDVIIRGVPTGQTVEGYTRIYTVSVQDAIRVPSDMSDQATIEVRTAVYGSLCGVRFPIGSPVLIYGRISEGQVWANLCAQYVNGQGLSEADYNAIASCPY